MSHLHFEIRINDRAIDPSTHSPEFHIYARSSFPHVEPTEFIEIESDGTSVVEIPERNVSIEISHILLILEGSLEVPTMPLEDAVRIGANAIYNEFGFCISGLTGRMLFIDSVEDIRVWVGNISSEELTTHSYANELFHFAINAETGELLTLYMNTVDTPFRG